MQNLTIVTGRMTGPTSIELDRPLPDLHGEVEVVLRPRHSTGVAADAQTVADLLAHLPPGTLTREQIDQRLREERDSWEDAG